MYVFNKITVTPQLPERINKLSEIAGNLWWAWNTDFLKLFKIIDGDLWETVGKNPVKFLKLVSQERLENVAENPEFLKEYDKIANDFYDYMNSKSTWFKKNYPDNKNDLIAYFSAEYGLDQILPIYSGGLGILSGDHLKSASDLGIPLVAVGLLYKKGFFHQIINGYGQQYEEDRENDIDTLPIYPVKDVEGKDLLVYVNMPKKRVYLKVWQVNVGRVKLYLMDSDIDANIPEYRGITAHLYGGNQEMRIQQEIVLGMAGTSLLKTLGLNPTVYHMNEGHSAFLILELMKNIIKEKQVSFDMAEEIVAAKTVFTTHTPVPAGNDIFPLSLVETYFKDYWNRFSITKEEFFRLGMKPNADLSNTGFNMGILALKFSGKKNGVSKLHGAVSRRLFSDVWPNIAPDEWIKQKCELRKEKMAPVLEKFYEKVYLLNQKTIVNKKLKEAVTYAINQEKELREFLNDGRIPLTNSKCERAIRPFAVHRKNWLFADTTAGAEANAVYYSFIETAKLNKLNIYKYINYLLEILPQLEGEQKDTDIEKYLPWSEELPDEIRNYEEEYTELNLE